MAAMRFTPEQEAAISARENTLLVSAAAGSGKTAVLVERIVRLLQDEEQPTRLSRMLIMTFTRAAAGEMRERLARRIQALASDRPDIAAHAMEDLDSAMICTIHSYCQHLLEREFQAAGVDARLRVCKESESGPMMDRAFRDALNVVLEHADEKDQVLLRNVRQGELREMVGRYHDFLMNLPDPQAWMKRAEEQLRVEDLEQLSWTAILREKHLSQLQSVRLLLDEMGEMLEEEDAIEAFQETWEADHNTIAYLLEKCKERPEKIGEITANIQFSRSASARKANPAQKEWKERYAKLREAMKEAIKEISKEAGVNEQREISDLHDIADMIVGLNHLTWETHTRYLEEKGKRGLIDFADMEQMALAVLRQEELRERAQQEFDHIFVDECQDVSAVQDAIIQALHGENNCLFMVGDVKQSIYRFRHADPTLFLRRSRNYARKEGEKERAIFLQRNFRSTPRVLEAVNQVFRKAMREEVTELDYMPEDELIPGLQVEEEYNHPVEICLIHNPEKANKRERLQAEAGAIARRMKELKDTLLVDDGKGNCVPCSWRHMAVLMSTVSSTGELLTELLQREGIPVYFDGRTSFFDAREIREVKALLEIIDNPMQDIQLLCVLKMPLFAFSDEELAQIRNRGKRAKTFREAFLRVCGEEDALGLKSAEAKRRIDEWRFRAEQMPLIDLMWLLIRDSGYYAYCGAEPGGELRQANLRLMCKKADDYVQGGGVTLSGLIESLNEEMNAGDASSAKVLGEHEDLVRVMTMHKSKGLEFPVVFLLRLGDSLEGKGGTEQPQLHKNLGVCLPWINREMGVKRRTSGSVALKYVVNRDERAERCRLLYVAMTRAREKLVMVASEDECDRRTWLMNPGTQRVGQAHCMMDWVMQAVCDLNPLLAEENGAAGDFTVLHEEARPLTLVRARAEGMLLERWLNEEALTQNAEELWQPWWHEKQEKMKRQPLKTSVTSIVRQQTLSDPFANESEEDEERKRIGEEIDLPLRLSPLQERPNFLMEDKRATAAERGTLTHRFLSLVPLEEIRGIAGECIPAYLEIIGRQLVERDIFREEELRQVDLDRAAAFFQGALGQRMLQADTVRREWAFNLSLDERNQVLLQGIIDCAFLEDGQWILCDYKTDHILSEEAFVQRHRDQLNWYSFALSKLTGKSVREQWLYAIEKKKAILVQVER